MLLRTGRDRGACTGRGEARGRLSVGPSRNRHRDHEPTVTEGQECREAKEERDSRELVGKDVAELCVIRME